MDRSLFCQVLIAKVIVSALFRAQQENLQFHHMKNKTKKAKSFWTGCKPIIPSGVCATEHALPSHYRRKPPIPGVQAWDSHPCVCSKATSWWNMLLSIGVRHPLSCSAWDFRGRMGAFQRLEAGKVTSSPVWPSFLSLGISSSIFARNKSGLAQGSGSLSPAMVFHSVWHCLLHSVGDAQVVVRLADLAVAQPFSGEGS